MDITCGDFNVSPCLPIFQSMSIDVLMKTNIVSRMSEIITGSVGQNVIDWIQWKSIVKRKSITKFEIVSAIPEPISVSYNTSLMVRCQKIIEAERLCDYHPIALEFDRQHCRETCELSQRSDNASDRYSILWTLDSLYVTGMYDNDQQRLQKYIVSHV